MSECVESWEFEHKGRTYKVRVYPEQGGDPPWKWFDGHGPVREMRHIDEKRPGERVLHADRSWGYLYDFQAAVETALRDGWGTRDGRRDGETDRQYAARAAEADFDLLRRWCNDDWGYVWIEVRDVERNIRTTLGMIMYDSSDPDDVKYLQECAVECADDLATSTSISRGCSASGSVTRN